MSDSNTQELFTNSLTQEFIDPLVPTGLEIPENEPPSSISDESLALLNPDDLGTVLSVDSSAGLPGSTVPVSITISDAEGLQSLNLTLAYDPSILSIVDPDEDTPENEGVRRAGISADWELDPDPDNPELNLNNPVANVNEETGAVSISLVNTRELPESDEGGTILEIDFEVSADAELDSVANIDLQSARVGVNDSDIEVGEDNLADGNVTVGDSPVVDLLDTNINRFQNSQQPGTFLFATEAESVSIRENFSDTFVEEGFAFRVADEPGEDLIRINRFQNTQVQGTFLFATETESVSIRDNFSDIFVEEGIAFYVFGADSGQATPFTRFQNRDQSGTYVFASPQESASIRENFPETFIEEGIAFEAGT